MSLFLNRVASVALALAFGSFATACSGEPTEHDSVSGDMEEHKGGPLSASVGSGASTVDAPEGEAAVNATFGAFVLCRRGGSDVRLKRITLDDASGGSDATFWIRTVDRRNIPQSAASEWSPLAFTLGSPPLFDEKYAGLVPLGEFATEISGTRVSLPCDRRGKIFQTEAHGLRIGNSYQEILVALTTDQSGMFVPGFEIEYSADGDAFTRDVNWKMIVCGSRSTSIRECRGR